MITISSFYDAFYILFYGSVSVAGFGILFHHNTGRGHFSFLHQNSRSFEFWSGWKKSQQCIYPFSKAKETNINWGRSFSFCGRKEQSLWELWFQFARKKEKNTNSSFVRNTEMLILIWGPVQPCTMRVIFSMRLRSQVESLQTDKGILWYPVRVI